MSVSGKTASSFESSLESSLASSSLRWNVQPSVTWAFKESEEDVSDKSPPVLHLRPKLPRLLSKAGVTCSSHKHLIRLTDSTDEAHCKKVEEQINYDHLQKLEGMFREADVDGGGGLDMDEFRIAMKKIMGNIPDEDIDVIFMKVDTNCDGSVDWVTLPVLL
uniref:Uncharacterized protein n=1 Tax=Sphaerodactylus townsendi TaxID=933632 RepID=A0ACB8F768_9SAUR